MKRLALVTLAAALTYLPQADAQTLYTCGQGTVRGVQSIAEITTKEAVTARPARKDPSLRLEPPSHRKQQRYLVTVQLNDLVYTGQSSADVWWNFNPTRLAVNQSISICANSTHMVLDRLDGTDFRATIVRIERDHNDDLVNW